VRGFSAGRGFAGLMDLCWARPIVEAISIIDNVKICFMNYWILQG
jgi:hypothetical protein